MFFNQNGARASLTGQRLSDFQLESVRDENQPSDEQPSGEQPAEAAGLNMVMLIQVPLKQKQPFLPAAPVADAMVLGAETMTRMSTDVEAAVIGHGAVEGPFTEIDNLEIERDPDFPIRVTVQFYKATSNGVVSADDMREIHE